MLRKLKISLVALLFIPIASKAAIMSPIPMDEGMWLVSVITDINMREMQKLGFELTAEDIYSINSPSLKDAVMVFGGFCTGEFVSKNGLVFTNHHCGYDAIAGASTPEKNYLDNGFWAKNYNEEIAIPDLYVEILVRAENISDSIVPFLEGMDPTTRSATARAIINRITERETASTGLNVSIKPMFGGNQYFIFYMEQFNDVRLVGTPPQSIGNYGDDTDNWMWPRHTGDFSIFRVYADADNNSAEYSENNVPYKPKKFLKVDISGIDEGDFTMVIGYPGSTNRYLTSFAMKEVINESNPAQIDVFEAVTVAMKKEMDKDIATRLALSPDYSIYTNALKLYTGQVEGMTQVMDAVAYKQQQEKEFTEWLNSESSEVKQEYGNLLSDFEAAYGELSAVNKEYYYKIYSVVLSQAGNTALTMAELEDVLGNKEMEDAQKSDVIEGVRASINESYANYYFEVELNKTAAFLQMMNNKLPADRKPQVLLDILSKTKGTDDNDKIMVWTRNAYNTSVISSQEKVNAFLDKPSLKKLQADPLYNLNNSLYAEAMAIRSQFSGARTKIGALTRNYIAAQMKMQPNKAFYPDANFTLRYTYGSVEDFSPRDAVNYNWITYIEGVIEKMDNTDEEFIVPDKLYELYKNKDFGKYADKKGRMPVCFLSNNDITGGNSGSPILNSKGHLIGLAFDGNYEGTPGDYIVDPRMNRTINVDARYVLFIIDKFGGAQNIIDELEIIYW